MLNFPITVCYLPYFPFCMVLLTLISCPGMDVLDFLIYAIFPFLLPRLSLISCPGMGNVEFFGKFLKFNPFFLSFLLFLLSLTSCPGIKDVEFSNKFLKCTPFSFSSASMHLWLISWSCLKFMPSLLFFRLVLSLISCPGMENVELFGKFLKNFKF